ncbi:hypothetical protein PBI_TERROR_51 [Mycobacterium phage Terror]|uniref:Uncharacterized protein n=1 Tax=Mycobacterium phage Taheera TaxID=1897549 RepID=A0A1D8EVV7_9CAUD|nr:hypothetical protein KDW70_gp51 [Mycobacterium phage Taheera]AOT25162.1 hypothetical protein PBI_TAHEERA_51 [Mycobacterium phage Taheera]AOT25220.1 hypothetical protein PBI_TERROR_51 [Mycobacterium phage Terror]
MIWEPILAALGGYLFFAGRDVFRSVMQSEWMFGRILAADLRAIDRAQRRKAK